MPTEAVEVTLPVKATKPVDTSEPVKAMAPVNEVKPLNPNVFNAKLCDCCKSPACCEACCCPCCVVGANDKMINTGQVVAPCDGCGAMCFAHAVVGGTTQAVAIFFLGPLAAFINFGALVGCCVRGKLRAKYEIQGNSVADCCLHYWCGPCALCQEYDELTMRINGAAPQQYATPKAADTPKEGAKPEAV